MPKRPNSAKDDAGGKKAQLSTALVNPNRWRVLKDKPLNPGPVILWMSRDQRYNDNWALLHAAELAKQSGGPVAVAFNLVPAFLHAGARHFGFMLRGLKELANTLKSKGIPFFLVQGEPAETIPDLITRTGAAALVMDFSPLRIGRQWRSEVVAKVNVPVHEVDAHNIVPVWIASDKREVGARTLRTKIHRNLEEYLTDFPPMPTDLLQWVEGSSVLPDPVDWDVLIANVVAKGAAVPEVTWCTPGETAALTALTGPRGFLSPTRLKLYSTKRNDPSCVSALSGMSPYFHYGQIAPQRAALEAAKLRATHKESVESFLEEMVVRRELSDNFCFYTPDYDNLSCAALWARESLDKHRTDKREFIYTQAEFEAGKTHDELWNACQLEMVHLGKMHGFMRMYWAKKILEWTAGPEEAISVALYLNDKYELDGRDPNGYVGIMWSMAGIHDQGWGERAVFGKIRYMNYNGCKRKFDIQAYVTYVSKATKEEKAARAKQ